VKITAITPTCDRPIAFALAEKYMARQTVQPDEWVVADGGSVPVKCNFGQVHLWQASPAGAGNFSANLLTAMASANGDIAVFFEDDDWYASDHIERMIALADRFQLIGADAKQRYYNVAQRCWRVFANVGASLCQTAIRRELWPAFEMMIRTCSANGTYGIDTNFWRSIPADQWGIANSKTVTGIKGLPGRAGLGIGHRPAGSEWNRDPDLAQLRAWIGDDAALYEQFIQ
jgi:glycosyltransferase involved in cell wall biosynthesis